MFSELIDRAAAAAQDVCNTAGLPAQAQPLRDHAATFPATLEPELRRTGSRAIAAAEATRTTVANLKGPLDAWKGGDAAAAGSILDALETLQARFDDLMGGNESAYRTMSRYRDQVLADQRTVAGLINQLNARLAGLRSRLNDRRSDLQSQASWLAVLRAIPFPLPWVVAEIASLISSRKTLEQQIADASRELAALNGEIHHVAQGAAAVEGFSSQLEVLESSLQHLLNAISVMHGQLVQIIGSLGSGGEGKAPVTVEAYLATLAAQAGDLVSYLQS